MKKFAIVFFKNYKNSKIVVSCYVSSNLSCQGRIVISVLHFEVYT